ncbi:CARDB domain-containing protein [Geotalea toluenoxydans]|uniref:CARDB domain-containing protein n=1 Tax=Geotalea toluenoxydans TaxID=421624 RepID=UPI0006D1646B|nr:CARDB domain-containing protein [Geotalea toluenoxydans]
MKNEGLQHKYFGILLTLIQSFLLLTLLPFSSFADPFTAKTIGDYGNVTVIETSGAYDAELPDGTSNVEPRQAIAKEFFKTHKDEYDFLAIFTNYDFQLPKDAIAFYQNVKNDIKGIGLDPEYNRTEFYGSKGKLQGTIDMGNLLKLATNKLDPKYQFVIDTLSHEMLHRWGAFVKFRDWNGNESEGLLGYQKVHWSFLLDSGASTHYGNYWQNNGDGTFTSLAARKYYYSPLDLYLMGMIDKSKVPPMLLIENPAIDPTKKPEAGVTITGTPRTVTIDDIIAVNGERVPSAKDSQKQFKMAFILAVAPGTFTGEELFPLETVRNGFLTRQSILTDGKLLVEVASTPKDGFPTNPGVRPPASVPRTLPPNIDEGSKWLVSHQQADGSWTDYSLTSERDTAEAVSTLQLFPLAQQQFQAGLQWLNQTASSNTDFLARRIAATIKSGGDATALVQELLALRNVDGGWGTGRSFMSNAPDTALALKALAAAKYADQQVISKGIMYLQKMQASDGGWSSGTTTSLIQPTASVLNVLSAYRKDYSLENSITSAMTFLAGKQNSDGGFGNSPSTVYDSAEAVMALHETGMDRAAINKGVEYLLSQQAENGSWQESPYQTALAVRAVWQANVDPDLSIKTEEITFIPEKVTSLPTNAVLSAVVWNLGRTDVAQAKVAVYDGEIIPEKKVAEQIVAFPGSSPVTVTFSIPIIDGNGHLFYVAVDPDNAVKENNRSNNSAAKSLMPEVTYDFEVLPADVTLLPNQVDIGQSIKITAKVSNRGTSDAFQVPVRIFIDEQGVPFEIATFTADIPAGGSTAKEVMWKANKAGNGMQLTVQADPSNAFTETSKANNSASVPVTVNGTTFPNLSVSYKDMTITPSTARQGGDASISVLVRNDGFSTAENVKVNFYKGVASKDGVLVGSDVIPAIPAGAGVRASVNWTKIAESGSKIISVLVDPENTIPEFAKDDNFTFTTISVLSLPDLIITNSSISLSPSSPKEGDTVSIAVTVQNKGEQDAYDVAVKVTDGSSIVGTQIIPVVAGNSQGVATIAYPVAALKGTRQISVVVDPDNAVLEQTKDNNTAVKSFTIQNANLWVNQPYFSPNGDGVKDSTDFSFRLAGTTHVKVLAYNSKGEVVRTFSGGELDNTTGTVVTWDGKSDIGAVVADGEYQLKVLDALSGAVLGSLPVVVDNNRSLLTEVIGTKFFSNLNITPNIPYFTNWKWLPDESGIVFQVVSGNSSYSPGIYVVTPFGEDLIPLLICKPDFCNVISYEISPTSDKIAVVTRESSRKANDVSWIEQNKIYEVDRDGTRSKIVASFDAKYQLKYSSPYVTEIYQKVVDRIKWSPDGKNLLYEIGRCNTGWEYNNWCNTLPSYDLYVFSSESDQNSKIETFTDYTYGYWSQDGNSLVYSKDTSIWKSDLRANKRSIFTGNYVTNIGSLNWIQDRYMLVSMGSLYLIDYEALSHFKYMGDDRRQIKRKGLAYYFTG